MKHDLKILIFIVFIFFSSQVVGLLITNKYVSHETIGRKGEIEFKELPYGIQRPPLQEKTSFIWIIASIVIGTIIFLVLIKLKLFRIWKLWFFVAMSTILSISFSAFITQSLAAILAVIIASIKVFKPNNIINNIAEIFVYGGLAAVFVPIINIFAAFLLLIVISLYDIIAVYKTKHMVKLAEFQASNKIFAGIMIQYKKKRIEQKQEEHYTPQAYEKIKKKIAVLGGGDIAFPLIFAGVIMKSLMAENSQITSFLTALIIPVFVSVSLIFLLLLGKKDKFYPAMPVLSLGCFLGFIVIYSIF